jgi:hypothetical protein
MNAIHVFTSTLTLVAAVGLSACGGGETAGATALAPQASAAIAVEAPLLDDEGQPTPTQPAALPADPGARTRSTGYATPTQAAALERALGADVLSTEVGCCGAEGADLAVLMVYGDQAARDLPNSTPVLVRGADPRLAATVAQRLADAGFSRVWLVAR